MRKRGLLSILLLILAIGAGGCASSQPKSRSKPEYAVVYRQQTGSNLTNRYEVEVPAEKAAASEKPAKAKKAKKPKPPTTEAPADYVPRAGFR